MAYYYSLFNYYYLHISFSYYRELSGRLISSPSSAVGCCSAVHLISMLIPVLHRLSPGTLFPLRSINMQFGELAFLKCQQRQKEMASIKNVLYTHTSISYCTWPQKLVYFFPLLSFETCMHRLSVFLSASMKGEIQCLKLSVKCTPTFTRQMVVEFWRRCLSLHCIVDFQACGLLFWVVRLLFCSEMASFSEQCFNIWTEQFILKGSAGVKLLRFALVILMVNCAILTVTNCCKPS